MYKNMTRVSEDGDLLFVKPEELHSKAEREFLEYALDIINHDRYATESEENLKKWKEDGDIRYYRVPLMDASFGSLISTTNIGNTIKDRLKDWLPKNAVKRLN